MKLRHQRTERRLSARAVLQEPQAEQKTVVESLDFIQPGDARLLEQIGLEPFSEERDIRTALALPGLIFPNASMSRAFLDKRGECIQEKRRAFEAIVFNPTGVAYEDRDRLSGVLKDAEAIFLLRSLLPDELVTPNDQTWAVIQRQVLQHASVEHSSPSDWLAKLMYVDPIRFQQLPAEELRRLCLENIAHERQEYPVRKDKRQIRLLHALASTRLLFPDMVDASSLSTAERAVTRAHLEHQRAYARDEGGSAFAFYLYLLTIVEAPGLKVDQKGVHLFGEKSLPGGKPPDLPLRSEM